MCSSRRNHWKWYSPRRGRNSPTGRSMRTTEEARRWNVPHYRSMGQRSGSVDEDSGISRNQEERPQCRRNTSNSQILTEHCKQSKQKDKNNCTIYLRPCSLGRAAIASACSFVKYCLGKYLTTFEVWSSAMAAGYLTEFSYERNLFRN